MKELFERFGLSYSRTGIHQEAAARGDWTAAGERLLAYYSGKRQERCLDFWDQTGPEDYPPMPWGAASTHDQIWKNTPERVVAGYLYASGHVFDFSRDEDIDWASDVRLWADGGKYPYAQARAMLRRMYWLRCLDLYYLRGDEDAKKRAAHQLVRLLESWWQQWEEDEYVITAAIRIGEPMAQSGMLKTWFTFLPSPHISNVFKLHMLLHIVEQAEDVLKRAVWNPWIWGLDEAASLGYAGILLPELKAAPAWRQRCFQYLNEFMLTALRDDGTVKRMHFCPHYAGATATMPLAFLPQIAKLGYTNVLAPDARAALERLVDWIANVQKPDNTVPQITASDEQGFGRWIKQGASLFDRPDWLHMASAGESGSPPSHTSHILPDAGAFILRDGFTRDAMYAVLHNGDYHNIERTDLALDMYALGRTLVTAPGRYGYYMPEWKPYFATAGYNTLMVDGSPHQEWGTHSLRRRSDLSDTTWYLGKDVACPLDCHVPGQAGAWQSRDWAWGTHPNGFDAAPDVRWQRGLLFVKGKYWLVVDRIAGPGEHTFSLRWLLTPGHAVREEGGMAVHTNNADANVRLLPSLPGGAQVDIWHGSREPLRGWYSPENGVMLPAPQIEYTWHGAATTLVATLIVPYRSQPPRFMLAQTEPEPDVHCLTVCHDSGCDKLFLDLRAAGRAWLEQHDKNGTAHVVPLTEEN